MENSDVVIAQYIGNTYDNFHFCIDPLNKTITFIVKNNKESDGK
jgi:hypothetical protein